MPKEKSNKLVTRDGLYIMHGGKDDSQFIWYLMDNGRQIGGSTEWYTKRRGVIGNIKAHKAFFNTRSMGELDDGPGIEVIDTTRRDDHPKRIIYI